MKRAISLLLAGMVLAGLLVCVPFSVSAETEGDYEYSIYNGEAVIERYNGPGGDVVIPDALGGYPVAVISISAFGGRSDITGVVFPDTLKRIDGGPTETAFYGCTGLTSLDIPDSVESIGYDAFAGCTGLKSVRIGSGLRNIMTSFGGCGNLSNLTVDSRNERYYSEGNCIITKESKILVVGSCTSVIPDGVAEIGDNAFYGRDGLTSIVIPDSVKIIGRDAFGGCSGLTGVTIGRGVEWIMASAFSRCKGLTSVTIPSGIKRMGSDYADEPAHTGSIFSGCDNLTDIYCEVDAEPEGWSAPEYEGSDRRVSWLDGCNATVHWAECKHENVKTVQKDPTCTEDGYEDTVCTACGETLERGELPAEGHAYENGVCTVCGAAEAGADEPSVPSGTSVGGEVSESLTIGSTDVSSASRNPLPSGNVTVTTEDGGGFGTFLAVAIPVLLIAGVIAAILVIRGRKR